MKLKDYAFQDNAINKLDSAFFDGPKNVVLQAPTASGKTIMLIRLMDRLYDELKGTMPLTFVWLTPGAGELEEQSWHRATQFATQVHPKFLDDTLKDGFAAGTVTFLNWELVNNKNKIALKDGERTNLPKAIREAHEKGLVFVLVIDEEHRNQTKKAESIVDMFDAKKIYRASATPIEVTNAIKITVPESDVIAAHLMTREVVINDHLSGKQDNFGGDEGFVDAAFNKRLQIKAEYKKLNKNINPLVLIQFPDEKKYDEEIRNKVDNIKNFLIKELGEDPNRIAVWLSGKHINVDNITQNDSPIDFLFMKQAVSTGWDAPRAKILVKLRLNTSARFTIQTIGRIRRMPEQQHYDNELLDNSFVYSNDSQYVSDIINEHVGATLTQMGLKVSHNIFNLESIKRVEVLSPVSLGEVTYRLRQQFEKMLDFGPNADEAEIKKQFEAHNWVLGDRILSNTKYGHIQNIDDVKDLEDASISTEVVSTRNFGYEYDAAIVKIMPYLHVNNNLKDARAVISDLFSNLEPGSDVKQILKLSPNERYAFVINNVDRIRDIAEHTDDIVQTTELSQFIDPDQVRAEPFELPPREGYLDNNKGEDLLKKNVYAGYSLSNLVKQSKGEKEFEKQAENIDQIKWIYRSKDHGEDYFSIVYGQDLKGFYPDYLVKLKDGTTYIIEIKGTDNIDDEAEAKFDALKQYVTTDYAHGAKFAFVRQSSTDEHLLLYSNTKWDENVDNNKVWKPLSELFSDAK